MAKRVSTTIFFQNQANQWVLRYPLKRLAHYWTGSTRFAKEYIYLGDQPVAVMQ